jgi:hypothetical protein
MLSHFWRDGPFPHCRGAFRSVFSSVIETAATSIALAGIALSPIRAASDDVEHESLLGAGAALAAQLIPNVWLGGEARYLRDYSGAALNAFSGQAVYAGPTLYVRLGRKAFFSAVWNFQIWGKATAASGALDLVNFERHQAEFRFGFEF